MLRIPGMPLLPGTLFRDLSKTHFPKTQGLMNQNGISMLSDRQVPKMADLNGMVVDVNCPPVNVPSLYPPRSTPKLPTWIAYDKKVLCFNAYFKETLQEVYHAPYQVRKVKIYYYLEDGTLQITEPKVANSGIPQGLLVHRQRVPKPAPCQADFISILDLNVNTTIEIFDRCYHITGCDLFTRHFLNRSGISVADPVEEPVDPTTEMRKRAGNKSQTAKKKNTYAQFLQYDRMVLKFHGYWDDRSEFGDLRQLDICYYLADDTIDIKEIFPRNSGREGPALFLKRQKLPREFSGLQLPGQQTRQTILNVLGNNMRNVRYCVDPLDTGKKEVYYYNERDLQVGAVLNVFGRSVVLTGCDTFTQDFYRKKYGIEEFPETPVPTRTEELAQHVNVRDRKLPPYNGWGSYEDSEGNCISVEPKPPQPDFKKFISLDRYKLRFGAKLLSTIRENCERSFIIVYYLADDTIQIYEVAARNSGFLGGEFMKRTRIPLPGQDKYISTRPQYYQPHNFFIGSTIELKDHIFHVVSADEYTLIYMEHHPFEFPMADIKAITNKIREAVRPNYKSFVGKCLPEGCADVKELRFISYETLKGALIELLGNNISTHEIITLCRHFSAEMSPPDTCNRDTIRAAAHLELKRALWNAMDELKEHLSHINPSNKPFISEAKVRSTLKGCRLPFTLELIDDVLKVLNRNDCNEIEVCDFLNFLDLGCGRLADIPPVNLAFELCPKIPFLHKGRLINFNCFIQHLGLEEELKAENE